MIASSQSFSMIHWRILLSPDPAAPGEERGTGQHDGQTRPVLVLDRKDGLKLGDHVLQKQQRAVVHSR